MRFCMLTTFFPPYHFGGDGVSVSRLANLLVEAGHSVDVVHCADSFQLLHGSVQPSPISLNPAVRVHTIQSGWGPLSPMYSYLAGRPGPKLERLREILSQDFDVTHWHNVSLLGAPDVWKLGKGVRLYSFRDYWLICPTNLLFRMNRELCRHRTCLRCLAVYRRPYPLWRATDLLQRSLRHIDRFLSPSRYVQQEYANSPLKIESTMLYNFIPEAPKAEATPEGVPYYLFVGRLAWHKGLQTVLPLFRNSGRRLLIAGAGEDESRLRRMAGSCPNVAFLGRVPNHRLPALYAGARATIIPSICGEMFSNVTLESLQQRTPLVTSNYGALPEIIGATGGGWVYSGPEELEDILQRLDCDPELARRTGERGSQGLGMFSAGSYLKHYLEIIAEVRCGKAAKKAPLSPSNGPATQ